MRVKLGPESLCILAAMMASSAQSTQAVTTLIAFNNSNGSTPDCSPVLDSAGNVYGTTEYGGLNGYGTIYKVAAGSHSLTTLATFNGTNGAFPEGNLMADSAGNLYGTTFSGGSASKGSVFEFSPSTHSLKTLASFNGNDGFYPEGSLAADASGNLYGTTYAGGSGSVGTLFEVTPGNQTPITLFSFDGSSGYIPYAGVTSDSAGNLFGTASEGGPKVYGTVFEFSATTHLLTTLAAFNGTQNGQQPVAGLVADSAGNLYGTTEYGGSYDQDGTVFKINAGTDAISTLGAFNGSNGKFPVAGVILDQAGNIFGTTSAGGTAGAGTVFEIAAGSNVITTLANFQNTDGADSTTGLVADTAGNLYGTTSENGPSGYGTVFELSGTGFVVPEPASLPLAGAAMLGLSRRWRKSRHDC